MIKHLLYPKWEAHAAWLTHHPERRADQTFINLAHPKHSNTKSRRQQILNFSLSVWPAASCKQEHQWLPQWKVSGVTSSSQLWGGHCRYAGPFPLMKLECVLVSFVHVCKNCTVANRFYTWLCEMCFLGTSSPCYNDVEMLTEFNWDDCNIRRVFIRKVQALSSHYLLYLPFCELCISNDLK